MVETGKRKPGRPRDASADRRILAAARAVAGEVGIHGASMSAIADRSNTGKPTIYLRWADRREVMVAAIRDVGGPVDAQPGSLPVADELVTALLDDRQLLVTGDDSRFLRSALFESATDDDIAAALESAVLGPRRERLRGILERGLQQGAVRHDVDPDAAADLLIATLVRGMVLGGDGASREDLEHHAGLLMAEGIASTG